MVAESELTGEAEGTADGLPEPELPAEAEAMDCVPETVGLPLEEAE